LAARASENHFECNFAFLLAMPLEKKLTARKLKCSPGRKQCTVNIQPIAPMQATKKIRRQCDQHSWPFDSLNSKGQHASHVTKGGHNSPERLAMIQTLSPFGHATSKVSIHEHPESKTAFWDPLRE
jgi:hypothetical protein